MSVLYAAAAVAGSLVAILTLPGTLELLMLSVAGLLPSRRRAASRPDRFRLAIVVPAHNEELNIAGCVKSLLAATRNGIDLTIAVVADNCEDQTAEVAREAGARVLVRKNATKRGKGYALDYAFGILQPEGYDAYAVIDADSNVSPNLFTETVAAFHAGAEATQCSYVVRNSNDSVRTRLLSVALLAFNVLRPRGRDRLGLSAGIYGNGFALSAATLKAVPYTADSVVEDLEFHLALVRAGRRVQFLDRATVYGEMPVAGAGVKTQRARWEGGRFRMMAEKIPLLTVEILKGRLRLMEPCLDLMLLPLAFHVLLLLLAAFTPFRPARDLALAGLAVVVFHLFAAIAAGGGTWKDVAVLGAAPFYVLWKVLLLPKVIATSRSGAAWVRTERVGEKKLP
jgi:cellulose synthase/poly-beta-1,6-N-acetylglucosamine synthase-like glycosyltransferase